MSNRKRSRGRPSKYPPEFQRDAVAMVLDEGRAIAEVARAIGVNEGTLGNWVARERRGGRAAIRSRLMSGPSWPSCGRRTRSCGWSVISNDRWPSG
jgi:transposase